MHDRDAKVAQERLRGLLAAAACFDRIDAKGGVGDLEGDLQQQAADAKAATKRCIEILTGANTDEECAEALRAITDILRPQGVMAPPGSRPLLRMPKPGMAGSANHLRSRPDQGP